jgi:hypothetical protein
MNMAPRRHGRGFEAIRTGTGTPRRPERRRPSPKCARQWLRRPKSVVTYTQSRASGGICVSQNRRSGDRETRRPWKYRSLYGDGRFAAKRCATMGCIAEIHPRVVNRFQSVRVKMY